MARSALLEQSSRGTSRESNMAPGPRRGRNLTSSRCAPRWNNRPNSKRVGSVLQSYDCSTWNTQSFCLTTSTHLERLPKVVSVCSESRNSRRWMLRRRRFIAQPKVARNELPWVRPWRVPTLKGLHPHPFKLYEPEIIFGNRYKGESSLPESRFAGLWKHAACRGEFPRYF